MTFDGRRPSRALLAPVGFFIPLMAVRLPAHGRFANNGDISYYSGKRGGTSWTGCA